ncbi:MAG: hypothetical protein ACXIU8_02670 [Alkalilacustris sp.]
MLDLDGTALFESPTLTIAGTSPSTFVRPWTSSSGLRIQWGPDAFNAGIDTITFSVQQVDGSGGVGVIPLPASLGPMGGGATSASPLFGGRSRGPH